MNQYELIGVALARALSGIASEQQLSAAIEAFANLEKKFTKPDGFQTRRKGTSDWGGVITHRPPDSYELRECEIRNIYIAPPPAPPIPNVAAAPHPQVEVTDEMCARAALYDTETESALLGPALGMTAWREPTEEECERIYSFWISAEGCIGRTPGERMGRIMFAAVREVMGGGE